MPLAIQQNIALHRATDKKQRPEYKVDCSHRISALAFTMTHWVKGRAIEHEEPFQIEGVCVLHGISIAIHASLTRILCGLNADT